MNTSRRMGLFGVFSLNSGANGGGQQQAQAGFWDMLAIA
jgi:hypothetical protein